MNQSLAIQKYWRPSIGLPVLTLLKSRISKFRSSFNLPKLPPTEDLDGIRRKSILVFNLFFSLTLLPILALRIYEGQYVLILVDILTLSLLVLSSLFVYLDSANFSILISGILIPFIGFYAIRIGSLSPEATMPIITLLAALFILLNGNKRFRLIYSSLFVFAYTIVIYETYPSMQQILPHVINTVGFTAVFLFLSSLLESQEKGKNDALKKLQESSDQLKSKNQDLITLNSIMSHDLKYPVWVINHLTELINQSNENQIEHIDQIRNSSQQIQNLLEEVRVYLVAEESNIKFSRCSLDDLIRSLDIISPQSISINHLQLSIGDMAEIYGNPLMLKTLFTNLISNSLKYQPNYPGHSPRITIESEVRQGKLTIYYTDNGIGIPKAKEADLFRPFQQFHDEEDYPCSGLGLSLCARIMEKHQGNIGLLDSSGFGTTFYLTFPYKTLV